jgi:hypothetical protein
MGRYIDLIIMIIVVAILIAAVQHSTLLGLVMVPIAYGIIYAMHNNRKAR